MVNEDYGATRWQALRQSAAFLISRPHRAHTLFSVVAMSPSPKLIAGPTEDPQEAVNAIDDCPVGGTACLAQSLVLSRMVLGRVVEQRRRLYLFAASPQEPTAELSMALASLRASVFAVAFGEAADPDCEASAAIEIVARQRGSFVRVPPFTRPRAAGVDSLVFHVLRAVVRDRETARAMPFSSPAQQASPAGSPKVLVDKAVGTGSSSSSFSKVPVLRTQGEVYGSMSAMVDVFKHATSVDNEAQLPPMSFSVALSVSSTTAGSSGGSSSSASSQGQRGSSKSQRAVICIPVQQISRDVIVELQAGRVFIHSSGLAVPAAKKGNLALVRLSSLVYQVVWRDCETMAAEFEVLLMRGEARAKLVKRPDGRLLCFEMTRPTYVKRVAFWLQDPDDSGDDDLLDLINDHLTSLPPAGGLQASGITPLLLGSPSLVLVQQPELRRSFGSPPPVVETTPRRDADKKEVVGAGQGGPEVPRTPKGKPETADEAKSP
eukprot:m51a1_g5607 hypothetical protein (491) ;mRNA; r:706773-708582